MQSKELEAYRKAGQIATKVVAYAKETAKPGILLKELAEKIEDKILELKGEIAFPVNLAINEIAAHSTPSSQDETKASGLLKIDIGVAVDGYIADTAFSVDLTPDKKHTQLIKSSQDALETALKKIKNKITLAEVGKIIQETITASGFSPIRNLSGHSLGQYLIHAGLTIPNYDNGNTNSLKPGAYAVEPFATNGAGIVYDGGKSTIYRLDKEGAVRDPTARKIYQYILEHYKTLPFCERWLTKKFGSKTRIALMFLEKAGILHQYAQLVEKSHSPVSQAEHTLLLKENSTEILTN